MIEKEFHTWTGGDGTKYTFEVLPKETNFQHVQGNYIFAKKVGFGRWHAVYIGEGYLDDRTQDHEHLECAATKGFTHYHAHKNENDTQRKAEEKNLIDGNPECLEGNGGCNGT